MPRGKGSLLIAEFEGTRIDWAEWTAESILREIAANKRKPVLALAHWLAIFSPPPPKATKTASRPPSQGTSGGTAVLTAQDDVYIPEPLPKIAEPEEQLLRELKRKGELRWNYRYRPGFYRASRYLLQFSEKSGNLQLNHMPRKKKNRCWLFRHRYQTPCSQRIAAAKGKHGQKLPGQ